MAIALVMGNMIGSGIFLLPASLAPYGLNSVIAWLLSAAGAIALAVVLSRLSRAFPDQGGPYAYTREAFGPLVAFLVAWGYWISVWVGNAAIATGSASYLAAFFPSIAEQPHVSAAVVLALLWLLTAVNCAGVRAAGWVQGITTILKIVPLLAIVAVGLYAVRIDSLTINAAVPWSAGAVTASMTLTLFALVGLESATIPDGKVANPKRTIPLATMIGTVLTSLVYVVACSTVLILLPTARLASSNAPFADVARMFWGRTGAALIALAATVSGFGALNGWILLQGEVPYTLGRDGVFPRMFARTSRSGAPVVALVSGSVLVSILVVLNAGTTTVRVFTFMVLLSTTACLVMYLVCSLALLRLQWQGRLAGARRGTAGLAVVGLLATLYSVWAIVGAGLEASLWGLVLLALGGPVYWLMRRGIRGRSIDRCGGGKARAGRRIRGSLPAGLTSSTSAGTRPTRQSGEALAWQERLHQQALDAERAVFV
jgi:basic amino acid/polyamine antiporter, APA family